MQRPSFLTLTLVVKKILLCSAAGFESVQSVQKNGGNYMLAQLLQQLRVYILVMESAACLFNINKGFQKRMNLLRPDV